MADLESKARITFANMIVHANSISLLPRGLALLAAFTFKCAVVGNHIKPSGDPFFSRWARYNFRSSLSIPSGIQMWIGGFRGEFRYSGRWSSYYFRPKAGPFRDIEFYVFTYVAGGLALQLLASRWVQLHQTGMPLPNLRPDKVWETATLDFGLWMVCRFCGP